MPSRQILRVIANTSGHRVASRAIVATDTRRTRVVSIGANNGGTCVAFFVRADTKCNRVSGKTAWFDGPWRR